MPALTRKAPRNDGPWGLSVKRFVERAQEAMLTTMLAIVADWVLALRPSPAWERIRALLASLPKRDAYVKNYGRFVDAGNAQTWRGWFLSALTRTVSDSWTRRTLAIGLGAIGTAAFVARHGRLGANAWHARKRNIAGQ